MLTINLSVTDDSDAIELHLEHSLVSLSKWESKHQKPFFGKADKTAAEAASYIDCMVLDENVPDAVLNKLSEDHIEAITDYINSKQSATWFNEQPNQKGSSEIVTSELIYYWLVQFNVPFEVENWHLNRLMTLVKICGIKQTKAKPMTKAAQREQYARLNAERRANMGTNG